MADDRPPPAGSGRPPPARSGPLHEFASIGNRALSATLKPFSAAAGLAADAGIGVEHRALDRLLESGELERLLDNHRLQAMLGQVLSSPGARKLVDTFFDSGLLDHFLDRLLESPALWHLIDEIAGSPAVLDAVSQQGLGFADQVGEEVRNRSRKADDWLERAAQRIVGRHRPESAAAPETGSP
jgi:hypothetical protein